MLTPFFAFAVIEQQEQINSLKNMVEALKLEISLLKESLSSHTAPTVPAPTVPAPTVPAPTVPTSLMPASPTANGLNGSAISYQLCQQSYSGALKGDTVSVLPLPTSQPTPAISAIESEKNSTLYCMVSKNAQKAHPDTLDW